MADTVTALCACFKLKKKHVCSLQRRLCPLAPCPILLLLSFKKKRGILQRGALKGHTARGSRVLRCVQTHDRLRQIFATKTCVFRRENLSDFTRIEAENYGKSLLATLSRLSTVVYAYAAAWFAYTCRSTRTRAAVRVHSAVRRRVRAA